MAGFKLAALGLSGYKLAALGLLLVSTVQAQTPAQNQASYTCAGNADNGKIYTVGGVQFELKCGHGTSAKQLDTVHAPTLKDCADLCAQHPDCQSCDWVSGNCARKQEWIPTFPYPVDTWFPLTERPKRSCPTGADILTSPKSNPIVVDAPKCPDDNGNLIVAGDNSHWTYQCCTHSQLGQEISGARSVVSSSKDCAEKCSLTNNCLSFVYANTGASDPIGTCKVYETGGFSTEACNDQSHDYGYITGAPAITSPDTVFVACPTECPEADGREYKSKGEAFHMDCAKRHGTQIIAEDLRPTFKDCMDACSQYVPCHSVDYHTNSKKCYYSNHHGAPTIAAPGFQSAYSLGCAGTCDDQNCCSGSGSSGPSVPPGGGTPPPGGGPPGSGGPPPSSGGPPGGGSPPPSGGGPPGSGGPPPSSGGPPGSGGPPPSSGGPPGGGSPPPSGGGPPGSGGPPSSGGPPPSGGGPPSGGSPPPSGGGPPGSGSPPPSGGGPPGSGGPPSGPPAGGPPGGGSPPPSGGGPPGSGGPPSGPPAGGPPGGSAGGPPGGSSGGPPGGSSGGPPAAPLAPGSCPPDDGKERTVDGVTYQVLCKKAYSTGYPTDLPNMSEQSCIKACSAYSTCQGANFNTNTKLCELHPSWEGQPKYTGDTTYWIAYRPIHKR